MNKTELIAVMTEKAEISKKDNRKGVNRIYQCRY